MFQSTLVLHLFFVSPSFLFVTVLGSLATTHLLVTHVGPCDDSAELLIKFDELTITTQIVDCSLTGVFNLTQDIANGWKVKGTMQKCQDIRNVETCDFLNAFDVVTDGCAGDNDEEEESYGMLFHYVSPEIECPVRSGVYKLNNYPFFTEDNFKTVYETKISTSVFGYTFNLDGFAVDGQKVFCVEAYLQLIYKRDHSWLNHANITSLMRNIRKQRDSYR